MGRVVAITGPPGVGKSWLRTRLCKSLGRPGLDISDYGDAGSGRWRRLIADVEALEETIVESCVAPQAYRELVGQAICLNASEKLRRERMLARGWNESVIGRLLVSDFWEPSEPLEDLNEGDAKMIAAELRSGEHGYNGPPPAPANRVRKICAEHGCGELVESTVTRCPRCEAERQAADQAKPLPARTRRTPAWLRLREAVMRRDSFGCRECGKTWARHQIRLEVDHINGDPFDDRPENLQTLCVPCHEIKHGRRPLGTRVIA